MLRPTHPEPSQPRYPSQHSSPRFWRRCTGRHSRVMEDKRFPTERRPGKMFTPKPRQLSSGARNEWLTSRAFASPMPRSQSSLACLNREITVRILSSTRSASQTLLATPTMLLGLLLCCLLGLHALGCATVPPPQESQRVLRLVLKGPNRTTDRVLADLRDSNLAADIWSPSGIGGATLICDDGSWPENVTILLHLVTLEGFTARSDTEQFSYALSREENSQRHARHQAGGVLQPIEITIPRRLLAPTAKELSIEWVDTYRG